MLFFIIVAIYLISICYCVILKIIDMTQPNQIKTNTKKLEAGIKSKQNFLVLIN